MRKIIVEHSKTLTMILNIVVCLFVLCCFFIHEAWNNKINIIIYVGAAVFLCVLISVGIGTIKENIELIDIVKEYMEQNNSKK